MGAGGSDDDLGAHGSNSDFDSRVSILSQLPGQHLVEFREEDSISDELKEMANKQKHSWKNDETSGRNEKGRW